MMIQNVKAYSIFTFVVASASISSLDSLSTHLIAMRLIEKPTIRMAVVGTYNDPFKHENLQSYFHTVYSDQYNGTYQVSVQASF